MDSNSKRLAKNTLLLYFRMLFIMATSLYTSRIVLQTLGVEDFGIYNVVGGIVTMFSIISNSLCTSISRFITYELGKGDKKSIRQVFGNAVAIQIILACLILIFAETIGLWFLNNKMTIPVSRLDAAQWCFHLSLLTFVINLISVPYNAAIIAHENMKIFAYISIFESLSKLSVAIAIGFVSWDKLVIYAILLAAIAVIVRIVYGSYCRVHYEECRLNFSFGSTHFKNMFSFASWNFIGATAGLLRDHGGNILLNIFFGPVVNAARGISMQVNQAVYGFSQNFMTALNPQITKNFAQGNKDEVMKLIFWGSRISFYLLFFLALPILTNTEFVLKLWLKKVPDNAVFFVQLILIFSLIESVSTPLVAAQAASGKIKYYQIFVGGTILLCFPVSFLFLKEGYPPSTPFIVSIVIAIICLFIRPFFLKKMFGLKIKDFFRRVVLNVLFVSSFSSILPIYLKTIFSCDTLPSFLLLIATCFSSTLVSIGFIGCSKKERKEIYNLIVKKLKLKS